LEIHKKIKLITMDEIVKKELVDQLEVLRKALEE